MSRIRPQVTWCSVVASKSKVYHPSPPDNWKLPSCQARSVICFAVMFLALKRLLKDL